MPYFLLPLCSCCLFLYNFRDIRTGFTMRAKQSLIFYDFLSCISMKTPKIRCKNARVSGGQYTSEALKDMMRACGFLYLAALGVQ